MRKFKYWQTQSPDLSLVTNPFGINQISIFEWLQFIYLPRLRTLLAAGQEVPHSQVLPYAEHVLVSQDGARDLLACMAKMDILTTQDNL